MRIVEAPPDAHWPLAVAEGIETALSLACGLLPYGVAVWATLSAPGLSTLRLPSLPGNLLIAADGDSAGLAAADQLARRASKLGWAVALRPAPDGQD